METVEDGAGSFWLRIFLQLIKRIWSLLGDIKEYELKYKKEATPDEPPFIKISAYPIAVHFDRTITERITAGKYDWVQTDIEKFFKKIDIGQLSFRGKINLRLFHFNKAITSVAAQKEMEEFGFRPATFFELLALGEYYPELQRSFRILCLTPINLGQEGLLYYAYLYSNKKGRTLNYVSESYPWNLDTRFAAVHK